MHISCILAGTLLARLCRPEVTNCIDGLKQYSYAYEEAGDQAKEMSKLYQRVRMGDVELNHMLSVAPRINSSSSSPHSHHGQPMVVDEHIHMHNRMNGNGSSQVRFPSFFCDINTNYFYHLLAQCLLFNEWKFCKTFSVWPMKP